MPALDDGGTLIYPPSMMPPGRPVHPSPSLDGLRLEVKTARELAYYGHVWGIDTPYLMVPTGFGEYIPLIYGGQ